MNWNEEYKKSLKMREIEEVFDLLIYRPLAFLLVRSVYKTTITPNNLTSAALLMGITAGWFYSLGKSTCFKFGALFYLAFNILDCSDGQLARLKKNGNSIGRLIDGISDYVATFAVYLGMIIGFAAKNDNPYYWTSLFVLAGVSTIVHGMLVDYYRLRFIDYVSGRIDNSEKEKMECRKEFELLKNQRGKWFDKMVLLIYFKYLAVQQIIISKRKKPGLFITTQLEYFKNNKIIIRFWLLLGPTTQLTILVICSFFNRLDIFVWVIVAGLNGLALILLAVQQTIDKTFKRESK
jgi:phosphatidylglycerophosphate synthase